MKRALFALLICIGVCQPAYSQVGLGTQIWKTVHSVGPSYQGRGDIVPGALADWGLRPYNAAFSGNIANVCDQSTGLTCANVTAAAGVVTFPTIGGVACNNSTNICIIKTLFDQIGNGCAAGANCDETTIPAGSRFPITQWPVLVMPGASNGCTDSTKPCISTNGGQCFQTSNNITITQPFSYVAVFSATGNGSIISPEITNTQLLAQPSVPQLQQYAGSSPKDITIVSGTQYAVQGVYADATAGSSISLNAVTTVSTGIGTSGATAEKFGMFAINPCAGMTGTESELTVYPFALTSTQITNLNANDHSAQGWGTF